MERVRDACCNIHLEHHCKKLLHEIKLKAFKGGFKKLKLGKSKREFSRMMSCSDDVLV